MELRTYNIEYLTRIESAQTKEELHRVYVDMANNAFLQFWFDRKNWEKDEKYTILPLEEQRIKLRELLDMNQLYLNAGDMYDARHGVSPLDQSLTAKFYGKKD
jgi:adenine-specific DNA-methyltransferase